MEVFVFDSKKDHSGLKRSLHTHVYCILSYLMTANIFKLKVYKNVLFSKTYIFYIKKNVKIYCQICFPIIIACLSFLSLLKFEIFLEF